MNPLTLLQSHVAELCLPQKRTQIHNLLDQIVHVMIKKHQIKFYSFTATLRWYQLLCAHSPAIRLSSLLHFLYLICSTSLFKQGLKVFYFEYQQNSSQWLRQRISSCRSSMTVSRCSFLRLYICQSPHSYESCIVNHALCDVRGLPPVRIADWVLHVLDWGPIKITHFSDVQ